MTNPHGAIWANEAANTLDDTPAREIRAGYLILSAFLVSVLSWSALAPLDAAERATGEITVSGHDEAVAHREGGVLAEIDVVEGQHVRAGQILAKLAPESLGADVSALKAQVTSLQAQRARLTAELDGSPTIAWPNEFLMLSGGDMATADSAMRTQQALFDADAEELRAQAGVANAKAHGLTAQISGAQGQLAANDRQQELLGEQLRGVSSLAAQGYAPVNSVRALQRSAAELAGARDQIVADIGQSRQGIAESALTLQAARQMRTEATASALRETSDQLTAALPKLASSQAQLDRGILRARVDGVVTGLTAFSPGAVIAPGQRLLEVVPDSPKLVVEGNLPATAGSSVHAGQGAEIRLTSPEARLDGLIKGTVTQVSADSFADERSGQRYFTVTVTVPRSELARAESRSGATPLKPGLPVEVMIPLRKRSAFEYLFEPITQSIWRAFRQP